jgi:hypothetical protein
MENYAGLDIYEKAYAPLKENFREIAGDEDGEILEFWIDQFITTSFATIYRDGELQMRWRGFLQAMRSLKEIEIPPEKGESSDSYDNGYDDCHDDFKSYILRAGYTYTVKESS